MWYWFRDSALMSWGLKKVSFFLWVFLPGALSGSFSEDLRKRPSLLWQGKEKSNRLLIQLKRHPQNSVLTPYLSWRQAIPPHSSPLLTFLYPLRRKIEKQNKTNKQTNKQQSIISKLTALNLTSKSSHSFNIHKLSSKWHLLPVTRSRRPNTSALCIVVLESQWKTTVKQWRKQYLIKLSTGGWFPHG